MKQTSRSLIICLLVSAIALAMACAPKAMQADHASLVSAEVRAALRPVVESALEQTGQTTVYDPAYIKLTYPGGDLPIERGVCADVIVRAFRKGGVDLQKEVHEDMARDFAAYPNRWGLKAPDANIDHRRVPNLMTFFKRRGKSVGDEYQPGDIVAWRLPGALYHIGIVSADGHHMIHNIGRGAQKEDVLKAFQIIGHYRW